MARPAAALVFALLVAVFGMASAQTQPAPFRAGDTKAGKHMVDRDCVACHAQRFSGDPDQMYRRSDRRIKTPAGYFISVSMRASDS